MKKFLAIFFLSIYLLATTEAGQVFKLPVIFQHYQEHKHLDKDLTILEFIDIHYMHGSPRDADYDRDMQLPFKSPIHSTIITSNFVIPALIFFFERKIYFIEKKKPLVYSTSGYSFNFHSSIWQPPKAC
jgi:hypothetical protein